MSISSLLSLINRRWWWSDSRFSNVNISMVGMVWKSRLRPIISAGRSPDQSAVRDSSRYATKLITSNREIEETKEDWFLNFALFNISLNISKFWPISLQFWSSDDWNMSIFQLDLLGTVRFQNIYSLVFSELQFIMIFNSSSKRPRFDISSAWLHLAK